MRLKAIKSKSDSRTWTHLIITLILVAILYFVYQIEPIIGLYESNFGFLNPPPQECEQFWDAGGQALDNCFKKYNYK